MLGNKLINTNAGGGCTNTVDLYNPFPDGGGVALYQLNGDATDESGNYDGTATNITYGAGEFGQAAVFNGSSSYIDTPLNIGNIVSNINDKTQDFSFSCWVNISSATNVGEIIYFGNATTYSPAYDGIALTFYNGNLRFEIFDGTNAHNIITTINANSWYNIVCVRESSIMKLYVNNSFIGQDTQTNNSSISASTVLRLGANINPQTYLNGSIDQFRVFNRALRPYEVEALYTEEYCTPTIVPSEHFNTVTYTGNGTSQSITSVGFQPDLSWIKNRNATQSNRLYDSVRGVNLQISSNQTAAESNNGGLTSFDSNGFSLDNWASVNTNSDDYVAWNFKAGGAAVTNTDGTITSQVSANTEAGFSVVSYTAGGTANVGHGLGSAPSVIITKNVDIAEQWFVYHKDVGTQKFLGLNTTSAAISNSGVYTSITDATYTNNISGTSRTYINYCFAEVEGFSNFGSYVGTAVSGNTVVTGFEPAFLMIKRTDSGDNWLVFDNKRSPSSPVNLALIPNSSAAEEVGNLGNGFTFLENGFNVVSTDSGVNANGGSYIYMAFAADPTAVEPSLEDSFNTVLYTGTGSTNPVTGVGFQPDFVWLKKRSGVDDHFAFDSVRGAKSIYPNLTNSENSFPFSFNTDGFTVPVSGGTNGNGDTFVAWNWKGAEIPAINSNGSIPSVVSANPAAGFSIVTFTGNGQTGATVGHGLGTAPAVVINKGRANLATYNNWYVWHKDLPSPNTDLLILNNADAVASDGNYFGGSPTDSTLIFGNDIYGPNVNGTTYVNYVFAEVAGFSKFGSYNGGSTGSGNVINTGFKPMFVMVKRTDISGDAWQMFDSVRGGGDTFDNYVQANDSAAEVSYNQREINLTANGFYWTFAESGSNISGGTYIYMAFANQF